MCICLYTTQLKYAISPSHMVRKMQGQHCTQTQELEHIWEGLPKPSQHLHQCTIALAHGPQQKKEQPAFIQLYTFGI